MSSVGRGKSWPASAALEIESPQTELLEPKLSCRQQLAEFELIDKVGLAVGIVLLLALEFSPIPPIERYFVEQDPDLSHPKLPNTVSTKALLFLGVVLPICILMLLRYAGWVPRRVSYFRLFYAYLVAGVMQGIIVDILKNLVGRPRPNFFALCDYQYYREASDAFRIKGNDTLLQVYLQVTQSARPGIMSLCRAAGKDPWESRLSFPSGHTSYATVSWGFVALVATWSARERRAPAVVQGLALLLPLCVAVWVGVTRIQDYWHREDDVMAGGIVGLSAAIWAWSHVVRSGSAARSLGVVDRGPASP